jgi:hypothetical protein
MKDDFSRWCIGDSYLFDGFSSWYRISNPPQRGNVYTREECINFLKINYIEKEIDWTDEEYVNELLEDNDFYSYENYGRDFEWFEQEFTTPSGETVVAFGYSGYDG